MTGCLNGGSCLSDDKKHTFSCLCTLPWTGEKCEVKKGKNQFCISCISFYMSTRIPFSLKRSSRDVLEQFHIFMIKDSESVD